MIQFSQVTVPCRRLEDERTGRRVFSVIATETVHLYLIFGIGIQVVNMNKPIAHNTIANPTGLRFFAPTYIPFAQFTAIPLNRNAVGMRLIHIQTSRSYARFFFGCEGLDGCPVGPNGTASCLYLDVVFRLGIQILQVITVGGGIRIVPRRRRCFLNRHFPFSLVRAHYIPADFCGSLADFGNRQSGRQLTRIGFGSELDTVVHPVASFLAIAEDTYLILLIRSQVLQIYQHTCTGVPQIACDRLIGTRRQFAQQHREMVDITWGVPSQVRLGALDIINRDIG